MSFYFQAILDTEQHSISYTLSRNQAVIVEYMPDEEKDMFQVRFDPS
jgi:pellino protein